MPKADPWTVWRRLSRRLSRRWAFACAMLAAGGCTSWPTEPAERPQALHAVEVVAAQEDRVPARATFSFLPGCRAVIDDRPDGSDVELHVRSLLEQELLRRGFRRVADGTGDLGIGFCLEVGRQVADAELDRRYGIERGAAPQDLPHAAGALVIDVVERRSARSLWRGSAVVLPDPRLPDGVRRARVQQGVDELIEGFAPRRSERETP